MKDFVAVSCPKCKLRVVTYCDDVDDIICPDCGYNLNTFVLAAKNENRIINISIAVSEFHQGSVAAIVNVYLIGESDSEINIVNKIREFITDEFKERLNG